MTNQIQFCGFDVQVGVNAEYGIYSIGMRLSYVTMLGLFTSALVSGLQLSFPQLLKVDGMV